MVRLQELKPPCQRTGWEGLRFSLPALTYPLGSGSSNLKSLSGTRRDQLATLTGDLGRFDTCLLCHEALRLGPPHGSIPFGSSSLASVGSWRASVFCCLEVSGQTGAKIS